MQQQKLATAASIVSAFVVALAPFSALAYLSPEEVFGGQTTTTPQLQPAPPNAREGDSVVEQQQARSAAEREAAQRALVPTYAEQEDTYVPPVQESESLGLFDEAAQYEKRQSRMEEAHGSAPTIIIGGDGTIVDSKGNVLHSGAPRVTATGPETVLAILAMILAAGCTFGYAQIRERRFA